MIKTAIIENIQLWTGFACTIEVIHANKVMTSNSLLLLAMVLYTSILFKWWFQGLVRIRVYFFTTFFAFPFVDNNGFI